MPCLHTLAIVIHKQLIVLLCFARLIGTIASAQTISIPVERYSLEQGLMQSMVTFSFADSNGLRWVGTGGGLHYFDGYSFHAFIHREGISNSLPDNTPRNMSFIGGNRYYINTVGSISVFDRTDGTFQPICKPQLSEPVFLGPQHDDILFFWTRDEGIFSLKKGQKEYILPVWENSVTAPSDFIPRKAIRKKNTLIVCGHGGILEINLKKSANGYASLWTPILGQYQHISGDTAGKIWVAANEKTYLYEERGRLRPIYENGVGIPSAFLIDSKGNHWIADASTQKLYRYGGNEKQTIQLTVREGRHTDTLRTKITFLDEDNSGNIWIGTDGQGLLLYAAETFRFNMAKIGFVRSITARANEVWAGTYKNGLWKLSTDLSKKRKITQTDIPTDADILALLIDRHNRLWIATERGIVVLDDDEKKLYSHRQDLTKAVFFESTDDTIVVSTTQGMLLFSSKNSIDYVGSRMVQLITTSGYDSRGIQWAGNRNYLYRLQKNQPLQQINDENIVQKISAKCILPFSSKIIVSDEGGVKIFDESGTFMEKIPFIEPLGTGRPYGLLYDGMGRIWMSSDRGLICFVVATRKWHVFDMSDNLQSIEFSSSAYYRAANGMLYYGGIEGINGFQPAHFTMQGKVSPPFLTRLFCADTSYCQGIPPSNISLRLNRDNTQIAGHVTTADYGQLHKRKYAFMLKGYDTDWSEPSERAEFSYEKVPPGEYVLLAKGIDAYGNQSQAATLLSLHIPPPFWQNAWFIVFASCFGIGMLVYMVRAYQQWRYQKIIRAWEQKDALNQERLRIARDLHDDIGAELSRIAILARNNTATNKDKLDRISEKTHTLIDNLRHIIWSTDPRNDKVDDLQAILREYVSGFAERSEWGCHIEEHGDCTAQTLSAIAKRNIFLILKECLNNTWKHAGADSIYLVWNYTPNLLEITYCDNGCGIADKKSGNGYGLSNMKERAETLGGSISISNREAGGIKIVIRLPLEQKR